MARTIEEIYNQIIEEKNKRLELSELNSNSKVSVFNGWAWTIATVTKAFESILDVFKNDVEVNLVNRINGTPAFYIKSLLEYQEGDSLEITNDGLNFGYPQIDVKKRIITRASYQEAQLSDLSLDKLLLLKVATGDIGKLQPLTPEQLVQVSAYVNAIKFAGTNTQVVSRFGDILLPRVTVYHDGAIPERILRDNINNAINNFIVNMSFDSALYVTKFTDALMGVEHVTDIYIDPEATPKQGVFVRDFNENGDMQVEKEIKRFSYLTSGYLRESSKSGAEKDVANFDECIVLKIETK